MMEPIRYYPLIRMSTDAAEYQPMTAADSERTVREHHGLWLSEVVRNYYRLGAKESPSIMAVKDLRIHCPKCGAALKTITVVTEESRLPLYVCDDCVSRR